MRPTGLKPRGRIEREPCGCAHDGAQWIEFCDPHGIEHEAISAAWAIGVSYRPGTTAADYLDPPARRIDESIDPWS